MVKLQLHTHDFYKVIIENQTYHIQPQGQAPLPQFKILGVNLGNIFHIKFSVQFHSTVGR
jgi:hypothetical protein